MPISRTPDYRVMERISEIIRRLESGEKLSIKELAKDYGCNTKTIQRDINERLPELFSQLGLGVKIEREGRLIKLSSDALNLTNFEDTLVVEVLEKLSEGMGTNFAIKAKKILSKIKKVDIEEHIYASVNFEDVTDKADEALALEVAMGKQNFISFNYEKDGFSYEVKAKPLKLICFDGFWYLLAEDTKDKKIKKYRLKAIRMIKIIDRQFKIPQNIKDKLQNAINVWFNANKESFEVRLYADKSIAKYFHRRAISKSQRIVATDSDGGIELSVEITDFYEIIPTVFYWMPNLLVLSPPKLKEKVEELAREFLDRMAEV